jgi:hypothetical protein
MDACGQAHRLAVALIAPHLDRDGGSFGRMLPLLLQRQQARPAEPDLDEGGVEAGVDPLDTAQIDSANLRTRFRRFADRLRQPAIRPAEDLELFFPAGNEDAMPHVQVRQPRPLSMATVSLSDSPTTLP